MSEMSSVVNLKRSWDWPKDMVESLVGPPSVTVATQEGEAELPQFLLLLAGALDGDAGEALAEDSPVVIAPEVSNTVVAALVSLLSSGRTPTSVSVADEAAVEELASNLGLDCIFSRESNEREEQIPSRRFWPVGEVGDEVMGVSEVDEVEVEDTSDEKYAKRHKKGERQEKKVARSEQRSLRWQKRNERQSGKKSGQVAAEEEDGSEAEPGHAATHIYVPREEGAPETLLGRAIWNRKVKEKSRGKSSSKEVGTVKSKKSSKKLELLEECKCCTFRGKGTKLLRHMLKHFSDHLKKEYGEALKANRCPECEWVSDAEETWNQKAALVRHIGVSHQKVLNYI